jgi:tetratricopeptide (TPR) repeat protein
MTLYNKIFGKKQSVSQEEIENYISANLSEKEKYEIELKAQSSDLDFDALEAFEQNPEKLIEFNNIKAQISTNFFKTTSNLRYFIITGIAATITIFFIFYADIFTTENNNKSMLATNSLTEEKENTIIQDDSGIAQELFIEDTPKEISGEKALEEFKSEDLDFSEAETGNSIDIVTKSSDKYKNGYYDSSVIRLLQKEAETLSPIDDISKKDKIAFAYNSQIKYLIHYKIVDYSVFNRENKSLEDRTIGLDARYSNDGDEIQETQTLVDKDLNLSYFTYLEKAILKYDKKEYTESISMFNTILEQYPNDLNAIFYKAMSYYQLEKYEKAIKYYNKSIESELNIFNQESEYYKALSLLHTNKDEGIKLLQIISNDALFYSQKAMIKLNEVNE